MPRVQHKSGAALRFERQRREATAALAAQAAQVRALQEVSPPPGFKGLAEQPAKDRRVSPFASDSKPLIRNAESGQVGEAVDDGQKLVHPHVEPVMSAFSTSQEGPKTDMRPEPGCWPITALRAGQCRFACTPHTARSHEHLFCGEPVAWVRGKPTSYCGVHLPVVSGQPGRAAGGASVADAAQGHDGRDARPARSGWGSTGA